MAVASSASPQRVGLLGRLFTVPGRGWLTLPVICFLLAVFIFPLVLIGLYSVNLMTNLVGVPTEFSTLNWESFLPPGDSVFWNRFQTEWAQARETLESAAQQRADELADRIHGWQTQLAAATEAATAQLQTLAAQSQQLSSIVEKEENLVRLQARLDENLESLRAAETFEQTLHSLNAAVHLLTARHSRAAAR